MSAVKWFSGPPPAVGWWPCGIDVYSWWDGKQWSGYVMRTADKDIAASIAQSFKANTDRHWRHWSIAIDGTDGRGAHE